MIRQLFTLFAPLSIRMKINLFMLFAAAVLVAPCVAFALMMLAVDADAGTSALVEALGRYRWPIVCGYAVMSAVVLFLGRQLGKTIIKPMERAAQVAEDLSEGVIDHALFPKFRDEGGRMLRALDVMQNDIRARIERDRAALMESKRITDALYSCSTNVMIADAELNIVYANVSVMEMLRNAEADLRQELPQFSVDKVIGSNIDIFHKNPGHQRAMLARLSKPHAAHLKIGPRYMNLVVSPVKGDGGVIVGFIVEWKDVTAEKLIETEVVDIVQAAANGEFDRRIPTQGKQGFVLGLATAINELLDVCGNAFGDIRHVMGAMAQGDLTQKIDRDYRGTLGTIMNDVNGCAGELQRLVGEIRTMSQGVSQAAREIALGNADLSSRTEQQAASIEETASSMEELTSTVRQNAESANQANQLVIGASDVARTGGDVVRKVVVTMSEISTSSRKIEDIISVIDGIAFQTNILALNAAVEAARAGEQGRGFAVVASEVRSLAQRSAAAAKEIKELIQDSVTRVGQGSQLVETAGRTMDEIVQSVQRVTDIMAEITAASAEQTSGIEQVSLTITQMDEMTQQNAALVEQASASARSLDQDSAALVSSVQRFRVDKADARAKTPVAQATPAPSATPLAPARQDPPSDRKTPVKPAVKASGTPASSAPALRPAPVAARKAAAGGGESADVWTEF